MQRVLPGWQCGAGAPSRTRRGGYAVDVATREEMQRWLRQRQAAAVAVLAIEDEALRMLTPEAALAKSDALLSLGVGTSDERRSYSGLVEQQRLFARARR